jgi:hypothetical protein
MEPAIGMIGNKVLELKLAVDGEGVTVVRLGSRDRLGGCGKASSSKRPQVGSTVDCRPSGDGR